MEKCFVIQPFDEDKFDKRFKDIFEPAIKASELEPYRVDGDPSVRVPIDSIEKNIKESKICFADITSDNPNVWYELGFAFAREKDVVMVCSEERKGNLPFDIGHRQIIKYRTRSTSDYKTLETQITQKLNAYKNTSKLVEKLNASPVVETKGLKSHEVAILILIAENQYTDDDFIAIYNLKDEMKKSGFTNIATNVGVKVLKKGNLIEISTEIDEWHNNEKFSVCKLTEYGNNWIIDNQDKLVFNKDNSTADDDIPF